MRPLFFALILLAITSSASAGGVCSFTLTPTAEVGGGALFVGGQFTGDQYSGPLFHCRDWLVAASIATRSRTS
jgi:hypothetical protein